MLLRRLLAVLMVLGSCIALDAGPTAHADTSAPTYVSSITGKGAHVNGKIAHLIGQARRGDTVQIALYIARMYSGDPNNAPTYKDKNGKTPPAIWMAIKKALDNGARVQIVTEGRLRSDKYNTPSDPKASRIRAQQTRAFFDSLQRAGAEITNCTNACIRSDRPRADRAKGTYAINHHKFFLLNYGHPTDHKGWKRIVIQSSANVHKRGDGVFEQAVAFDATFYDNVWKQYSRRFTDMKKYARKGKDSLGMAPPSSWRQVTAFIGPYSQAQQNKQQDEYLAALNRIKSSKKCRISIVMGHWTKSERSDRIVKRLNELVKSGCSVDAIVGNADEVAKWGREARFELEYTPNVHAKFMLLHYYDAGRKKEGKDPWRKLTYSGSHNFTKGSWAYDDDAFVRVDQPDIYDDFCKYFDTIERVTAGSKHYGKHSDGTCMKYS